MLSQGIRIINNKHDLLKTTDMRDRKMFLLRWSHASVNITKAALAFCARMSFLIIVFYITVFFCDNKYENNSSKVTDTE